MKRLGIRELILGIILMGTALTCVNADEWMKTYGPGEERCVQQTTDGGYIITGTNGNIVLIKTHVVTGVEDTRVAEISKNVEVIPNPSASSVSIDYCVSSPMHIELSIYNVGGKLIKVLEKGRRTPGTYKAIWDTGEAPSGVYFCILFHKSFSCKYINYII